MRKSFCGSHRERVEAAAVLQASRRRRRISLELDEFERPGGRALIEDSPEVEAYLAALSVAERPRRASLDLPRGAPAERPRGASLECPRDVSMLHLQIEPNYPRPVVPMEEDEDRADDEEVDSKLGAVRPETEAELGNAGTCESVTHSLPFFKDSSFKEGSKTTPKKVFASARRACASFVKKAVGLSSSSRGGAQPDVKGARSPGTAVESRPCDGRPGPRRFSVANGGLPGTATPGSRIVDTWAGEGKLDEWVDWGVVDTALRPPDLMQAQAALIAGSRGTGQLLAASAGSSKS